MNISDELKSALLADVENVCELNLTEETKTALARCLEITIGTRQPVSKSKPSDDDIENAALDSIDEQITSNPLLFNAAKKEAKSKGLKYRLINNGTELIREIKK